MSAALLAAACGDRLASTDEILLDPICMQAWGTKGYWFDGTRARVGTPDVGAPYACTCITEEEFWDEAEIERLTEELGVELLLECERVAEHQGFDWNDCQIDHDSGVWGHANMAVDKLATPFDCPGPGWTGPSDP